MANWVPPVNARLTFLGMGLLFATVGAEINMVAVVWTAADLVGIKTGYVAAAQTAAILLGSLLGGTVTDRWRHGKTLAIVNVSRFILLSGLAAASFAGALSLFFLIAGASLVALCTSAYDPALQGTIPVLVESSSGRHAINGLVDAVRRLARILALSLVAFASFMMPAQSFFAITSFMFLFSAFFTTRALRNVSMPEARSSGGINAAREAILGGWHALADHRLLQYCFVSEGVGNAVFAMGLLLGMVFHLQATQADPLAAYGLMMSCYAVGNILSNIALLRWKPTVPLLWVAAARIILGVGIAGLVLAPSIPLLATIAFFVSINGPLENLAILRTIQTDFSSARVPQIYRIRMCFIFGGLLCGYLMAPSMFAQVGVDTGILIVGAISGVVGLVGLTLHIVAGDKYKAQVLSPD